MRRWRAAHSSDQALADEAFALERCDDCGTARTLGPPPAAIEAHETSYYAAPARVADRLIEPLRKLAEVDRLRSVRSIDPGSTALEIGSGDGRFLARIAERGVDVVGVEPSPQARAKAEAAGVRTIAGGIEEAAQLVDSLDAVIAWHSLEHIDQPGPTVRSASEWLKPGGLLVVAVPNLASLQASIGGDRWFHQDVPRHRTHFTATGAKALIERCGFKVERVRHLVVEQNPLGMWMSLLNRVTKGRDVAYRALKRDPALKTGPKSDLVLTVLLGIPLVPAAIALELLAGLGRRGGTVVIEARAR